MQRTKLFYPYAAPNVCSLKITGSGVYYILEKNWLGEFKLVYIGFSGNDVKKTLYRHFQKWIDKRHPDTKRVQRIERVTYFDNFNNKDYKCKVIFCKNSDEAAKLELSLIAKLQPRDNSMKLSLDNEMKFYSKQADESKQISNKIALVDDYPF